MTALRTLMLVNAKRRLAFSRLARRYANCLLSFADADGGRVLVHRTTQKGTPPWRVTWFGGDGEPHGHAYEETHREAVFAASQYGAHPETVAKLP